MPNDILKHLEMDELDLAACIYFLIHLIMEITTKKEIDDDFLSAAKCFVGTQFSFETYEKCKQIIREQLPGVLHDMTLDNIFDSKPDGTFH